MCLSLAIYNHSHLSCHCLQYEAIKVIITDHCFFQATTQAVTHPFEIQYFPCILKTGVIIKQKKKIFFPEPTQEKNIAIRMILVLCNNKLLMLLALTWLWVTSSKRGANWETTLPANSVQLMDYLLMMINEIRMCLYVTVSNSRHLYLHKKNTKIKLKTNIFCIYFKLRLLFCTCLRLKLTQPPEHWPS